MSNLMGKMGENHSLRLRRSGYIGTLLTTCAAWAGAAQAQTAAPAALDAAVPDDIVVTAQKRSESINDVGLSITAATGDQLIQRGVIDVSQLDKVVPGFVFNKTGYGTPVYTIRGVGFQENSLGASPAVSVYVDEVPLPFSPETLGATLDLERVEVLKGPQGTFYGQNSTGGAVNYIAAKPLDRFAFGVDASYSRFNTVDLSGFVTSPLSDTLTIRLAGRFLRSDDWQRSISRVDTIGQTNQLIGRLLIDWKPTDRLKVSINANGWRDKSDTQAAQLQDPRLPLIPAFPSAVYEASPIASRDARAADWDPSTSFRQNNRFYQFSARVDYEASDTVTFTSLTSYSRYDRDQPVDTDGSAVRNIFVRLGGYTDTFFQELRTAGRLGSKGNWMIGANYQDDKIREIAQFDIINQSSAILGRSPRNEGNQRAKSKSVYANADFPLVDGVTLLGGIRYTDIDRSYVGCTRDNGDGSVAGSGFFPGAVPGGCVTFLTSGTVGEVNSELNQDNISWRAGLNYKPKDDVLLYATVSKGWKSGSFPLLSAAIEQQTQPVTQESVLAYEVGLKATVDRTLQFNAAAFYYDYRQKQIRGFGDFPPFGTLEALVNIPKSRVIGFEANAVWRPARGLTISPSATYVNSKINDDFVNINPRSQVQNFRGESFPYTPRWSGNTDVEYRFDLSSNLEAFLGGNVSYRTKTNTALGGIQAFEIKGYTLLDLRAGVEDDGGRWRASVWGQNLTDKYYVITVAHLSDGITRYAGRPINLGVSLAYRY